MFVKTQFETIVNLADFGKIKIEWNQKQETGGVFHVISAASEGWINPTSLDESPKRVSKRETLAQFPENKSDRAGDAYIDLFIALEEKRNTFDMTEYTS